MSRLNLRVSGHNTVLLFVLIAGCALSVFAYGQHALNEVDRNRHADCRLLELVSSNQVFVLRHHLAGSSPATRRSIAERIAAIRRIKACDK